MRQILIFLITQLTLTFTYFYSTLSSSCENTPVVGTVYSAGATPCVKDSYKYYTDEQKSALAMNFAIIDIADKYCGYIQCNDSSNSCTGNTPSCKTTGKAIITDPNEKPTWNLVKCKTGGNLDGEMIKYTFTPSSTHCECKCKSLLVELNSFITKAHTNKKICFVKIKWETATEIDTAGFNIWRAQVENGEYVNITKVNDQLVGIKTENDYQGASYSYEDHDVIPDNTYYYVLEDIDFSGLSTVHYDFIDSATVQFPLVGNL